MFCPNCQAELLDQAKFCRKCGASLASTPAMATPTAQNEAADTPSATEASRFAGNLSPKKKGLLAGVGSAVAVAIVAIIAVSVIAPGGALAVDESNFPDETFRAYVSDKVDKNHDKKLSKKEIDAVTSIDISSKAKDASKVSDLTGIGHFHGLRSLNASHNALRCLPHDFHRCGHVKYVDLSSNYINQPIDVTKNIEITIIWINDNQNDSGEDVQVSVPEGTEVETDHEASEDPNYSTYFPEDPLDSNEGSADAASENDEAGESATIGSEGESSSSDSGDQEEPSSARSSSDVLFAAQKDGKWGYVDEAGALAIDFEYDDAGSFSEGIAIVKKDSDYIAIRRDGAEIAGVSGRQILPFSDGYAYVASGSASSGSGLSAGTMVEAPGRFVDANGGDLGVSGLTGGGEFHAGYAPAKTSSGWGFVSTSGSWVVQAQYSQVTSVANINGVPVAGVCQGGTWSYIDVSSGSKAFDGEFSEASAFDSTGHAVVRRKASSDSGDLSKTSAATDGYMITNGRYVPSDANLVIVANEFDASSDDDSDGMDSGFDGSSTNTDAGNQDQAAADQEALRQKQEAEDQAAREAEKKAEEEKARQEEEERRKAEEAEKNKAITDKYVVIDGSGKDVGVIEQSSIGQMYEGLACVNSGGWGFVGTDGSLAIECGFNAVGRFSRGYAPAQDATGKWGIIDTSGRWVVQPAYSAMQSFGAL